jgi:hypothetical protein
MAASCIPKAMVTLIRASSRASTKAARLGTGASLLLGLRVSCVLEVCGAFGGRVLGEDLPQASEIAS